MPTQNALAGYILKKEACATYNRSFRQLARDFDKAIARGDEPFFANFKLRLEDGTILESTEVDKDNIQSLRDKGLNPTWFVRESWMHETYGLRTDVREDNVTRTPSSPDNDPFQTLSRESPQTPNESEATVLIDAKDDLIEFLREENLFLRDSLSKEKERSSEDKQLMRELHVLLKDLQNRILPLPQSRDLVVHSGAAVESAPSVPQTKPVENATQSPADMSATSSSEGISERTEEVSKPPQKAATNVKPKNSPKKTAHAKRKSSQRSAAQRRKPKSKGGSQKKTRKPTPKTPQKPSTKQSWFARLFGQP